MAPYQFIKIGSTDQISSLRDQYLDQLIQAQELYLEMMIKKGDAFLIQSNGKTIGYFILGVDQTLLEYFIISNEINRVDEIFGEIIQAYTIRTALCKSFDQLLLACCMQVQKSVKTIGISFRERIEPTLPAMAADITVRLAASKDEGLLIEVNEEVFDEDDEICEYIRDQKIFIFEKASQMIGFGIFSRVIPGRPHFDIGMLVTRVFRRQGYGSQILYYLINHCQKNGWTPVAGCAINNVGSRRSLEKAGFIARYRLFEFGF